jgi:hypothetical protein
MAGLVGSTGTGRPSCGGLAKAVAMSFSHEEYFTQPLRNCMPVRKSPYLKCGGFRTSMPNLSATHSTSTKSLLQRAVTIA